MTPLVDWLARLGAATLDALWLPLLAWTTIAAVVLVVLRLAEGIQPLVQYRAHLALLMALPLGFLLTPLVHLYDPVAAPIAASLRLASEAMGGPSPVAHSPAAPGAADGIAWGLLPFFGALSLAALTMALGGLARLGRHLYALRRLRNSLAPIPDAQARRLIGDMAAHLGLRRRVSLRSGPPGHTPMTFGWRSPAIALPAPLLEDQAACRMALLHELIHIRRHDFAWGVLERLVCSAFAIHPGVWFLRRRIEHFREVSCDAEVLAGQRTASRAYARMLFGFHQGRPVPPSPVLAVASSASSLKQRLHAMQHFRPTPTRARLRVQTLLVSALLLVFPALLTACSGNGSTAEKRDTFFVSAYGEMTEQEREEVLTRLQVQMDYLTETLDVVRDSLQQNGEHGVVNEQLLQRYQLLNGMYVQRLETFETLKMERETERRLATREQAGAAR